MSATEREFILVNEDKEGYEQDQEAQSKGDNATFLDVQGLLSDSQDNISSWPKLPLGIQVHYYCLNCGECIGIER